MTLTMSEAGRAVNFSVSGVPVQQGNHRRNQAGALYESSKGHKAWRDSVICQAISARRGFVFDGPVRATLDFRFPHLKSHYRTNQGHLYLPSDAPTRKVTAPDVDKLARAVLDALSAAKVYRDDAQVVLLVASKRYSYQPGVWVSVAALHEQGVAP